MRIKITLAVLLFVFVCFGAVAQHSKGLLWKITGKNIKEPTYLFGTVHLFDTAHYELPQPVFAKLKEVRKVYLELDFGKINPADILATLWMTDSSQFLNKSLDKETLKKLKTVISQSPFLGMLGNKIYQVKPFFLSGFMLAGGNGVALDMELHKAALAAKDSVGGLETVDEQLKAVDAIPFAEQVKMLTAMLKTFTSTNTVVQKLTETYAKQDIDNMLNELSDDMPLDVNTNNELIVKRNEIMTTRIANLLGRGGYLFAVGAGHLGGKNGLVQSLKKKGYKLKAVEFEFVKK